MSDRLTSEAIDSIISSPASEDGLSPFDWPDGPTTVRSGPAPVPVSRFRALEKDRGTSTPAISGPFSFDLSPSTDLQFCLENRLRARMAANGSPLYALTWKHWDMPSGPPICALRASAPRISDNGSTGWPTPCQQDGPNGGPGQGTDRLPGAVALTGWPTPTKGNADGSQMGKDASATGRRPDGSKATVSLNQVAQLVGPARLTASGEMLTGSSAAMASGGQLNPAHSRGLMGYPPAWDFYGVMAMQTFRRSPPSSSGRGKRSDP